MVRVLLEERHHVADAAGQHAQTSARASSDTCHSHRPLPGQSQRLQGKRGVQGARGMWGEGTPCEKGVACGFQPRVLRRARSRGEGRALLYGSERVQPHRHPPSHAAHAQRAQFKKTPATKYAPKPRARPQPTARRAPDDHGHGHHVRRHHVRHLQLVRELQLVQVLQSEQAHTPNLFASDLHVQHVYPHAITPSGA